MDAFSELLNGFAVALTAINLLLCLVGTTLGTAIGGLPGLGPALTIALRLPITFKVEPTAASILFAGIYYGAMYGGSTTPIPLTTPGASPTRGTPPPRARRGGQRGGPPRPRRRGARDRCHRLVRRGDDRHPRHHLPRAHRGGMG